MNSKNIYTIVCFLSAFTLLGQADEVRWSEELRLKQINNIHNPELWDMERMKGDIERKNERLPINDGAFPVPHYKYLGNYRGGGEISNRMARSIPMGKLMVKDKEIVFQSYHIGNSPFYKEENRNKVFFTVVTVVDSLSTEGFVPGSSYFLSRNHPDYGGEGSIITKDNEVEFVAFITPDKGSFAIVNMRLFHLEHGNIIVIAPHKDGSFRSLQIKGEVPPNEECFEYMRNVILKRKEVIELITADGVI